MSEITIVDAGESSVAQGQHKYVALISGAGAFLGYQTWANVSGWITAHANINRSKSAGKIFRSDSTDTNELVALAQKVFADTDVQSYRLLPAITGGPQCTSTY